MIIIREIEFLSISIRTPQKLWRVFKEPLVTSRWIISLLTFILMIPSIFSTLTYIKQFQSDLLDLSEKIPEFSIVDGKLKTEDSSVKGFVFQADAFIFTFDPSGTTTKEDISLEAGNLYPSAGLLADQLYVDLSVIDRTFSYADIPQLNKGVVSTFIKTFSRQIWIGFAVFILIFYIILLLYVLASVYFLYWINRIMFRIANQNQEMYTFKQLWQFSLGSVVLPIILYSVMLLLGVVVADLPILMGIFAMITFYLVYTDPNRQKP
ncbi:DUF1189 domain-containing protein [Granulicatella seriolae]|uniref:DUF1189 domain-containing protein n=1 Tax=Granulicatella seriolae TaxID=2967226 RepID=A0ABT1WMM4_9LACT|nr:DUF1189 domain-containing protein [Granulicatella seriolae]